MDRVKLYDKKGNYSGKFIRKEQAIAQFRIGLKVYTGAPAIWNIIVTEANKSGLYTKDQLKNMKLGQEIICNS